MVQVTEVLNEPDKPKLSSNGTSAPKQISPQKAEKKTDSPQLEKGFLDASKPKPEPKKSSPQFMVSHKENEADAPRRKPVSMKNYFQNYLNKKNNEPATTTQKQELEPPPSKPKKQWVDISPEQDGSIMKGVKKEGYGPFSPSKLGKGDTVYVHYVGTVKKTGHVFRSTRKANKEFPFTLGKGTVAVREEDFKHASKSLLPFWGNAVTTMKKGEKALFVVKAKYAYGTQGLPGKKKSDDPIVPPNATLIFDVELLRWEGEDVSGPLDGTITRSIVEVGEEYGKVNIGGTVEVHLCGWHKDRKFMDQTIEYEVGEASEIGLPKGLDDALQHMTTNEVAWIQMRNEWCYGSRQVKEYDIPRYADLDFEVTMIRLERALDCDDMDKEDRIKAAETLKRKGTAYFEKKNYKMAQKKFELMWEILSESREMRKYNDDCEMSMGGTDWDFYSHKTKRDELWQAAHLNLALSYMKLDKCKKALDHCDRCIAKFKFNAKAHFRKGQVLQQMKEFKEAIENYKYVLEIDENNETAKSAIKKCYEEHKTDKAKRLKDYGNFFKENLVESLKSGDGPIRM